MLSILFPYVWFLEFIFLNVSCKEILKEPLKIENSKKNLYFFFCNNKAIKVNKISVKGIKL